MAAQTNTSAAATAFTREIVNLYKGKEEVETFKGNTVSDLFGGMTGASNRNYVDPNIVSSVYVEKGPSFNRDVKSGIGGSVAMKTIDADDIVPEGQKYGLEVKAETSTNSVTPRGAVYAENADYRTLEHPEYSTLGMWRFFLDPSDRLDPRFSGKNTFGNDRAYRIAAGTKQ